MPQIRQLSRELAEMIAAGEVVERPCSVVKELLENAIDAGASSITVEIEGGGMTYIRVADNGCGIQRDDVKIAFLRHATSKISTPDDLFRIRTLGFRGEALAASAAVSKIDMLTKYKGESVGTHIRLSGGAIESFDEAGCPQGTTIIVRDLFFNMPARLKFMKRDATEAGYIYDTVIHAALSNPAISFTFIKNGKRSFFSPGDENPLSVLYAAYGREHIKTMLPVSAEYEDIMVAGFISKPENAKANRSLQDFFVNDRYVCSKIITTALEQAYKERMMTGRFPSCLLYITINPQFLDVNVHPSKIEVKFACEKTVFRAVYIAAKSALDSDFEKPLADITSAADEPSQAVWHGTCEQLNEAETRATCSSTAEVLTDKDENAFHQIPMKPLQPHSDNNSSQTEYKSFQHSGSVSYHIPDLQQQNSRETGGNLSFYSPDSIAAVAMPRQNEALKFIPLAPDKRADLQKVALDSAEEQTGKPVCEHEYQIIGELFRTYIIVEFASEILLIDKHAAHERMIFNRLSQQHDAFSAQQLLSPEAVTLKPSDAQIILENASILKDFGFELDDFGMGTVLVRSIPSYLNQQDIGAAISDLAEKLSIGGIPSSEIYTRIIERLSCISAVKANSFTTEEERASFVQKVLGMPEVKYCPHGRPIAIRITKYQIEKQFKRS